ncbi:MAG TPA: lipoprotein-releasing ABC transporter permease subunit [Burkholderiaceae bacterium]|nr:lipoprotein-releasing ABC transporter permease subunit [Burkholderiaceae bacterium]
MSFFSSFEWMIGLRYTRSKRSARRNRFISFISAISMGGIALGVAALIVVLSVMNGFQKEVRDRMLSVLSHIEVFDAYGALSDWRRTADEARADPEVLAAAPYVSGQAMFAREDQFRGALIRGVDPALEGTVSDVGTKVRGGALADLRADEFNVILGRDLASALGVRVGERVAMIVPQGNVTPAGIVPRLRQFTVVGVFESGHFEYDSALALVNIQDAQKLFRLPGASGVRLKVRDMQQAPQIAQRLAGRLSGDVYVRDWSKQNRTWFAAVQTEKRMMFIILTLIIAVAAFNLVSTLVMTVTDKQSDIAILRTLGASPVSIMRIFVVQGALVGCIGTLAGVAFGALIAFNIDIIVPAIERVTGVQFLPKDIYFISALPSDPRVADIATIGIVAFVLSLLATLYPSWSASRVKPAEALRYE